MSYATTNPPYLMLPSIGAKPALWGYTSADANATVVGTGYFTNGVDLGMKVDDFLISTLASSTQLLLAKVTTASSTGVTVTAGSLTST